MKISIKDLLFSVTLFSLVLIFATFARRTNQKFENLHNQFTLSQAAQSFAIHAFLVQEKFTEGGATFSANQLDFTDDLGREGIIFEIAYALPEEIQTNRVAGIPLTIRLNSGPSKYRSGGIVKQLRLFGHAWDFCEDSLAWQVVMNE